MRFGPTSLKASSILAKGLRRPKFRSDLRVSEQTIAGDKSFVVKVPETNSYNRFGVTEYELLALCDGTRTRTDVAAAWNQRHPNEPFSEQEVADFLDGIEPEVWERSAGERNLAVLERIRDERRSRLDQSSMLYISFKAWDPNRTLAKMDPYLGWLFTRGFVIFSVALFLVAAYLLAGDWTQVQRDTVALYTFQGKTAYDIWVFWFLLLGLGAIHEFGHGLTCKHFGGDVHQMGFLLIYLTPAFFTDTTDITLFNRVSRRHWVLFAGIWIELVICGIAVIFWRFTAPGSFANDFAYKTMLLSGIQGALLNLNPLIKADGYYALAEYLHIDNLREDSFAYLRAWVRKHLLFADLDLPQVSRRYRRVFVVFGLLALTYSVALLLLTVFFVKNVLVGKFGVWGYLLTLALVYYFSRKGLQKAWRQARAWWREKKEDYMAWRMTRGQQVGAVALAALFLIPPVPTRVASDFLLEPGRHSSVRAGVSGVVRQVFVRQGDLVREGQVLAVLADPDAEAQARVLALQLAIADGEVRSGQARPWSPELAAALQEQRRLEKEASLAQARVAGLTVRAPFAGAISTPNVEQKVGEYLPAGDELCDIADRATMKARILVRDWELEDIHAGSRAQLKVAAFAFRTYSGSVNRISPAASPDRPVAHPQRLERFGQQLTNYVAVEMVFPNPDGSLTEGMTGTAKIAGRSYPVAWQMGRGAWRWLRSQVW
ncbi:MAG TPA: HlyD family efflux transporter periplasmic adaptor subunit [Methylocystis sp.]|nr:HlyD family efflux transporter periplasmic adaptor subunit [Methylocystis sp.]